MVAGVIDRIQYAPRQGMTYEPPIDVLVPALMKLRGCNDSIATLVLIDSLPDMILPGLAWVASQKTYVPRVAVETLVKYIGPRFLHRCLGTPRARQLEARYPKRAALLGA